MASRVPERRFTWTEVQAMVRAGILAEDERLELLDGALVEMTPQAPIHASIAEHVADRLVKALGPGVSHRLHAPLMVDESNVPEPDVAVVPGEPRDYRDRHPRGADTLVVVEVARTSRARDEAKAALYARAGVPVYWIVDVDAEEIVIQEHPDPTGYTLRHRHRVGDTLTVAGQVLSVDELLLLE